MSSPMYALPSRTVPGVLADRLPRSLTTDIALVVAGAGIVGAASQVTIPLGFTPVPLSLSTFAVLLCSMALGAKRGLASMALFALAGMAGVPWFADQRSGWEFAAFGYILGYVLAAAVIGELARRRGDRRVLSAFAVSAIGAACVYLVGLPWLMAHTHMDLGTALAKGALPFLIGDAIKATAAAALLPATWKLIDRR